MPLKLTRREGSEAWWITGTVAGCRIRESARTADRSLAEERRATREAEIYRSAIHGTPPSITWAEAVTKYTLVKRPGPKDARFLLRLTDHLGRMMLSDITQDVADKAAQTLCRPQSSPSTHLRNIIGPMRAVMEFAYSRGLSEKPRLIAPDGASGNRRTRWLTPEEYVSLRDAAAPHLKPLIIFLACSGARLSEALSLHWEHVDLRFGRATLRGVKGHRHQIRDRVLDLAPAAKSALGEIPSRHGPVFLTDDGAPYADHERLFGGQIKSAWAGAVRRAGLPGEWRATPKGHRYWQPTDITPHVLRHTWATWHYAVHKDLLRLLIDGDWSSLRLVERYAKLAPPGMAPDILNARGEVGTPLSPPEGTKAQATGINQKIRR